MRLSHLYAKLNPVQRKALAKSADISEGYLYQLATRFRGCKPSVPVMNRLAAADKRLKVGDLAEEFSEPVPDEA